MSTTQQSGYSDAEPSSYADATAELARILDDLEADRLPVDDIVRAGRRAGLLIRFCRSRLQRAQAEISTLSDDLLSPPAT